jgi:hypothetical protein
MRQYQLLRSIFTKEINGVKYEEGGVLYGIPFDPDNVHYQEYLKWVAEGNEPLPADGDK